MRLLMPKHSRANEDGYVLEHLMIAEKVLGRTIHRTERVHHINISGVKNNYQRKYRNLRGI